MTEYLSYHGPGAGFKSIKYMTEKRGLSLSDEKIRHLEREMNYQAVYWLIKHLDTLK